MSRSEWENLKDGDVVWNKVDGMMIVVLSDIFSDEKEICLSDGKCIWRGSQFYPQDWEVCNELR